MATEWLLEIGCAVLPAVICLCGVHFAVMHHVDIAAVLLMEKKSAFSCDAVTDQNLVANCSHFAAPAVNVARRGRSFVVCTHSTVVWTEF